MTKQQFMSDFSLVSQKGWISIYAILLLHVTFSVLIYQNTKINTILKQTKRTVQNEIIEIQAVHIVKNDYLTFSEEDKVVNIEGVNVEIDYEGMSAIINVQTSEPYRILIDYDDINECITKFEYLNN